MNNYIDLPEEGGTSSGVASLNGLTGALTLVAGTGITITPSGSNITIASSGAAPTGPAGGDLGGTYPNPTVLSVAHVTTGVLSIANGGTNNSSAYTAGSIIYSNGTSLTQDNSNFFWNDANQSIGIGTNTPAAATFIDAINISGATKRQIFTGYGAGSIVGYRTRFARGTLGTPAAAQNGDILGFFNSQGYGASQFPATSTGAITFIAGETFTNTSNLTYVTINATPTGAVNSIEAMRVAATGVTLGPQSASTAIHQINGGINRTTRTITANLTVDTTTTDDIIYCNAAGVITITLPAPTNGRVLTIKDISGAATANNITIARHASENIEGLAASYIIQVSYQTVILSSDGTNWWIIG